MESTVFERIRDNLLIKRQNLWTWLQVAPSQAKEVQLGPVGEQAVQAHLHHIDTALEKAADQTLGLCEICHGHVEAGLLEMDYTACICIDHLSEEERRRLEWELELSQTVQKALLPQQTPAIPGVELAVFSRPAQFVSGDYFDFCQFRDGTHGLVIADVAGHGVSASLLMASLQTALRTLVPGSDSPLDIIRQVNRFFYHNVHLSTFITFFLGQYDPTTRTLTYCNAGHNPPLFFHKQANGKSPISWLHPTGAAIGLIDEFQITTETVRLAPGDILLFYTDGLTEMTNAQTEEFGQERLATLIRQNSTSSARELVGGLRQAIQEFTDGRPLVDDTTIIACRIEG